MSRLITNSIRSTSASADAITLDGSGNATFPANVTCSGTASGFGGGVAVQTQVHQLSPPTQVASTSTTFAATGLTKNITPTSASNKIKASANLVVWMDSLSSNGASGGKGIEAQLQITRTIGGTATVLGLMEYSDWSGVAKYPVTFDVWDTTYNSTAAITYSVEFRRRYIYSGNNACYVHRDSSYTTIATLTLTEYSG